MTTTDTAVSTSVSIAEEFLRSAIVEQSIEAIVRELAERQRGIVAARPARTELAESYAQWLARNAVVRGKPALYPYVGSGFGNGPLVELLDGSVKWDMINGIGVHMFGHSDPEMVRTALRAALGDTVQQGNLQANGDAIEFAEVLVSEASRFSRLKHAFITNSGCMANESALKVCFQRNAPASRVIAFTDCFMGRSTTMAQIGDSAAGRVGLPLNVLVDYMPFFDPTHPQRSIDYAQWHLRNMIARYPGQHACFVMELVQGEGGFNIAPREFLEPLMAICREHSIAVWIDEVQTFGRTESMYHVDQIGLGEFVDVLTLGKMSQACACLFSEEYSPKPGLLSGTFLSGTVELQVGRRVLERLRDGGYYGRDGRIAELQRAFRERGKVLVAAHPEWFPPVPNAVTGAPQTGMFATGEPVHYGGVGGMMRATPFGGDRTRINALLQVLFAEGVVAFSCGHGPYHLRFLPPIGVMRPEQFDEVFEILARAMAKTANA